MLRRSDARIPNLFLMDKTFRLIFLVFATLAASTITALVFSFSNLQRANLSAQWVNHTHAFITEINAAANACQRAESALNAFLLSDSPDHREQVGRSFSQLSEHLEVAKALAESDVLAPAEVSELETLLIPRAEHARRLLAAHRAGDTQAIREYLGDDNELANLEITQLTQRIVSRHQKLLQERDQTEFKHDNQTRNTLYIGAGLNLLLLVTAGWFIRDNLKTRQREAALLASTNEVLEARVADRTAELAETNRKLRSENIGNRWSAQALEHQLRYNNLIIESVASPVVVITRAFNISRVNPALENLIGALAPVLIDQSIHEYVNLTIDKSSDELIDPFELALRSNQDLVDHPAEVLDTQGNRKPVLASLFPLRDHDRVVGGVITLRRLI